MVARAFAVLVFVYGRREISTWITWQRRMTEPEARFTPEPPHICGYSGRGHANFLYIAGRACHEPANARGSSDTSGVTGSLRSRLATDRPRGRDRWLRRAVVSGFAPGLACLESGRTGRRVCRPALGSGRYSGTRFWHPLQIARSKRACSFALAAELEAGATPSGHSNTRPSSSRLKSSRVRRPEEPPLAVRAGAARSTRHAPAKVMVAADP